jgi:uncharacterized membrane protein YkvA (DUF1232 family)
MIQQLMENGRLAWRLLNDPRVPSWIKFGIPLVVVLYFFSPIDIIPDFILGPGQVDDLAIILLGLTLIVRFSPQAVVDEHKRALGYGDEQPTNQSYDRPAGDSGEPTRSVEGEYRVVPTNNDITGENRSLS